ncbi:uncharacterized protein LOC144627416 [Crassostrea virginica]
MYLLILTNTCIFIYRSERSPPSIANKFRNSIFFEEWSRFLDRTVIVPEELVLTGDLNFHFDNPMDTEANKFLESLEEHGLSQHVIGKTHVHGHTLDVLITRENSSILSETPSIQDPHLCDNKGIPSGDHLAFFSSRRSHTSAVLRNPKGSSEELVKVYNSKVQNIIDKHAPLQRKVILLRPNTQWYTDELHAAKRERRKAERQMRKTTLEVHKQI